MADLQPHHWEPTSALLAEDSSDPQTLVPHPCHWMPFCMTVPLPKPLELSLCTSLANASSASLMTRFRISSTADAVGSAIPAAGSSLLALVIIGLKPVARSSHSPSAGRSPPKPSVPASSTAAKAPEAVPTNHRSAHHYNRTSSISFSTSRILSSARFSR